MARRRRTRPFDDPEVAITRHLDPFIPRNPSPFNRVNARHTIAGLQKITAKRRAVSVTLPSLTFLERTDEEATSR